MKMPEIIEDIMLAPCGMNCAVCYKHVSARKDVKPCPGCLMSGLGKPEHCRTCNIKECSLGKRHTRCYECCDFPCKLIKNLEKSYIKRYGVSLVDNGRTAKEQGISAFLTQDREKWTCPCCGGAFSLHDNMCSDCGGTDRRGAAQMNISITYSEQLKEKPRDESTLGYGRIFTDHMFAMNYTPDKGWHSARIIPYAPLSLDPATSCLHYGQLIFEGMKAYRSDDGQALLFRPERNMRRFNESCARISIPQIDEEFMVKAIARLVDMEKDWIPRTPGMSMYIRPFIMGTEAALGVHPSESYLLLVIAGPVGHYFPSGLSPIKVFVEDEYVRAVKGGVGAVKCAGNYAASLAGQVKAKEHGCSQVLWLDGVEHKYVDEVGSMNAFFIADGKVLTPELSGAILPGVTRDSVITLLESWGIPVEVRKVSMRELADAADSGKLEEAFGCGTAAVIAPFKQLLWGGRTLNIGDGDTGPVSKRLYDTLIGIQRGSLPDTFGWSYRV